MSVQDLINIIDLKIEELNKEKKNLLYLGEMETGKKMFFKEKRDAEKLCKLCRAHNIPTQIKKYFVECEYTINDDGERTSLKYKDFDFELEPDDLKFVSIIESSHTSTGKHIVEHRLVYCVFCSKEN